MVRLLKKQKAQLEAWERGMRFLFTLIILSIPAFARSESAGDFLKIMGITYRSSSLDDVKKIWGSNGKYSDSSNEPTFNFEKSLSYRVGKCAVTFFSDDSITASVSKIVFGIKDKHIVLSGLSTLPLAKVQAIALPCDLKMGMDQKSFVKILRHLTVHSDYTGKSVDTYDAQEVHYEYRKKLSECSRHINVTGRFSVEGTLKLLSISEECLDFRDEANEDKAASQEP
jgi:hypothetical protein